MDKFALKRKSASADDETSAKTQKVQTPKPEGPKPQTASIKTVKKWERELGIALDFDTGSDENIVIKIWCNVCRNHSSDKSSSEKNYYTNFSEL